MTRYRLYTDGSSHARGGKPGGWAWILVKVCGDGVHEPLTASVYKAQSGGEPDTSNNRMEMTAILKGLKFIAYAHHHDVYEFVGLGRSEEEYPDLPREVSVEICSDSQYALNMAAGTWNASSNADLVRDLRNAVAILRHAGVKFTFSWVRGHNGEPYNELVDRMATGAKDRVVKSLTTPQQ